MNASRILIVEDHADTRMVLRMYLEQMGFSVTSVGSVAEALCNENTPKCEILISDIGLPDGDGWKLVQQLRTQRAIYAIAMSGFGSSIDERRSKLAGFQYHLVKPIDLDELGAILSRIEISANA